MFNQSAFVTFNNITSLSKSPSLRSIFSIIAVNLLFILFIAHLVHGLERIIFINEIISLFGFCYYLKNFNQFTNIQNDPLLLTINCLLAYCFIRALTSIVTISSFYGYLRTLVLFYSIFGFFVGTTFIKYYNQIPVWRVLDKCAIPLSILTILYGNNINSPSILPLLFKKYRFSFAFILLGLITISLYTLELTALVICFCFLLVSLALHFKKIKLIIFHPLTITISLLSLLIIVFFMNFKFLNFYLDHNYSSAPHLMNNSSFWRLMFWAYELTHQLPNHLFFGIGFGTSIYDTHDPSTWFISRTNSAGDPNFPYTVGTHNFLIYSITRLGIIGFLPIFIIYILIFNKIRRRELNQLTKNCFFAFVLITTGGLSNVIFVTPLYASSYWIFLGMLYECFRNQENND